MKRFTRTLALLAGTLLGTAPVAAATFDAFTSFTGVNFTGNYFYGASGGGVFTPFTSNTGCQFAGVICLEQSPGSVPAVYKSTIGAFEISSLNVPAAALVLHPGSASRVLLGFFAPVTGDYDFDYNLFVADDTPSGVDIFTFVAPFGGTSSSAFLTNLGPVIMNFTGSRRVFLNANDSFGISIGNAGAFQNDSIGVNFSARNVVTNVPEPGTWALFIAGFGMVGGTLRQRRTMVAS